jgi:hypothetical protein
MLFGYRVCVHQEADGDDEWGRCYQRLRDRGMSERAIGGEEGEGNGRVASTRTKTGSKSLPLLRPARNEREATG